MSFSATNPLYLERIADAQIRARVKELIKNLSVEFYESLFGLLQRFSSDDLNGFVERWSKVDPLMQSAFVAFIVSGDDPDGRFLEYLDDNESCQEAVDIAFRVHIDGLHDLGRSLAKAEEVLQRQAASELDAVNSALSEAVRAEDALGSFEESLENIATPRNRNALTPLIERVQQAITVLGVAKSDLKSLVNE